MIKAAIFDFNRTVYDPENDVLSDGVLNILQKFLDSGLKMCLLSKKSREDRRQQISNLGLDKYFVDIQVIDEKNINHFKQCLDKMNVLPEEVIVIGDQVRKEIKLGNEIGMTTVWYKMGKFADRMPEMELEEADYIIDDLSNLNEVIEN